MNVAELKQICKEMRRDIINMTANAGSGHPGGSLSSVELMASVFCNHMRIDPADPKAPGRDRFVLSKGHAAPCYYAVLAELGFIDKAEFIKDPLYAYENKIYCKGAPLKTGVIWDESYIERDE